MELTAADRESKTWQKIKEYCERRRENLRTRNDGKMSETDRNFLIGQINEINTVLALEKPGVVIPPIGQG